MLAMVTGKNLHLRGKAITLITEVILPIKANSINLLGGLRDGFERLALLRICWMGTVSGDN
jgi:hypothetical protein